MDEWISSRVAKWLDAELHARFEARITGRDQSNEHYDRNSVRRDLYELFQRQVNRPIPARLESIMEFIGDLRDEQRVLKIAVPSPMPSSDRKYEEEQNKLIHEWNAEWKELRGSHGQWLPPSLSGAEFKYADLRGIDLTNADLGYRRDERSYRVSVPNHECVNLSGARLVGANLAQNRFVMASLEKADLTDAYLVAADLTGANLRGAKLRGADLRNACLVDADLTGADLVHANLQNAEVHQAILDEADLRFSRGLLVDENSVNRTRFTGRGGIVWRLILSLLLLAFWVNEKTGLNRQWRKSPYIEAEDRWSALRRLYTGPNLFISLLFLALFAAPYIAKIAVLQLVGETERLVFQARGVRSENDRNSISPEQLTLIRERLMLYPREFHARVEGIREMVEAAVAEMGKVQVGPGDDRLGELRGTMVKIGRSAAELAGTAANFQSDVTTVVTQLLIHRQRPAWQILLGIDPANVAHTILIFLLLLYNGLRWFLTTTISPIRDNEDRNKITPAKIEYQLLIPLHRVVATLWWLSTAIGGVTLYRWLILPIWMIG